MAALAAVVVLLAPLLILAGGLFSLPSLIERGVASLTAGLSERTADRAATTPPKVLRLIQPQPQPQPQGGRVAPPRTTHRSGLRPTGVTHPTPAPPTTSQSIRSTPSGDVGITGVPVKGRPGSASPVVPQTGTEPGTNPVPVAPEPPAVSVGVNGTTTAVTVDTGPAPVTATATVSVSPSAVTVDLAAAVDAVGVSTEALTGLSPPAVTTTVTAPVVSPAVSLLGG